MGIKHEYRLRTADQDIHIKFSIWKHFGMFWTLETWKFGPIWSRSSWARDVIKGQNFFKFEFYIQNCRSVQIFCLYGDFLRIWNFGPIWPHFRVSDVTKRGKSWNFLKIRLQIWILRTKLYICANFCVCTAISWEFEILGPFDHILGPVTSQKLSKFRFFWKFKFYVQNFTSVQIFVFVRRFLENLKCWAHLTTF